ncbi:MAG: substrate-binding domain-containing protein [Burkholderiales bacterium]
MSDIAIRPAWTFTNGRGESVDPQLFALLREIRLARKLTVAARAARLSYRHAWNLVKRWEQFFGVPLVILERGRGAHLSPLGEKLLWCEQRAHARLGPQLESLASELNLEIGLALSTTEPVIRLHASHGFAVAQLPALIKTHTRLQLDLQYRGSIDALVSLSQGGCDIAGFHVPEGPLAQRVFASYASQIDRRQHRIIHLVRRTQGLMLMPGNPLRITSLADLARPGVRFVNRQPGSGTRLLLDELLADLKLAPTAIHGYRTEEFTHAAVAAFVASGMADAGFGVQAAADQFKLDFQPVATERYLLLLRADALEQPACRTLLELIRSPAFAQAIVPLAGYDSENAGTVLTVDAAFPWLGAAGKAVRAE